MELPPGTKTIWQELQSFQNFMSDFQATIKDPARKEMFGDLLGQLKKASAEAQQVVPGVVQGMKGNAEQTKAELEALQKEFERIQEEMERAKAQAAKPAATMVHGRAAEPAIQANLSKQYTAELLQTFGPSQPAAAPDDSGSLWRHVDQMPKDKPPAIAAPAPQKPTEQPKPPAAGHGEGSLWRMLDDDETPGK